MRLFSLSAALLLGTTLAFSQTINTSGQNWNLLGATEDISDLSVFTDECVNKIWVYDGSSWGSYSPGDNGDLSSIAQGKGFWLKSKGSCDISAGDSTSESTPTSITTSGQNWYLLGATEEIPDLSIFTDACVQGVWAYDGSSWGSYTPGSSSSLTSIEQGKGFWLKSKSTCTITTAACGGNLSGEWTLLDDFSGSELDTEKWGIQESGNVTSEVTDGSLKLTASAPTSGDGSFVGMGNELSTAVSGTKIDVTPETVISTDGNEFVRNFFYLAFQPLNGETSAAQVYVEIAMYKGVVIASITALNEDDTGNTLGSMTLIDSIEQDQTYTLAVEVSDGVPIASVTDASGSRRCYSFNEEIDGQYAISGVNEVKFIVAHLAASSQSETSVLFDNAKILGE